MTSTVRLIPCWKETPGTVPQTENSPGTSLQIKNSLRRPAIERQSEARDPSWVGTRSLSLRVFHLLMTTLLPVHVFSQTVTCQSSFWWTIGCARRWKSLISPSLRATLQEIQELLASSKINSSSLPGRPDGMGCILIRRNVTIHCMLLVSGTGQAQQFF